MINGRVNVPRVTDKSYCRTTEDYYLTTTTDYKIHSTSLMPQIQFDNSAQIANTIDASIFINTDDTALTFVTQLKIQNYLTTHYIGRAPLEYYGPKTKMGYKFQLICMNGDPSYKTRYFGTTGAINDNANANDMTTYSN